MSNRSSIYILLFFLVATLVITACLNPKSDDIPGDTIELGHFALLDSTVTAFPYQSEGSIVFVDSMGNERVLFLSVEPLSASNDLQLLRAVGLDIITYNFTTDVVRYVLKNDSFATRFELELTARPYADDPESGFIADVLYISAKDFFDQQQATLFMEWNLRTWPNSIANSPIESIEINNVVFNDVYRSSVEEPVTELYFSRSEGIVSYTDRSDVIWRIK